MIKDEFGTIILNEKDIIELLYRGIDDFNEIVVDGITDNEFIKKSGMIQYEKPSMTIEDFDKQNRQSWFVPDEYKTLNVIDYVLSLCANQNEIDRCCDELELFVKYEMIDVLRFLIYFIKRCDEEGIIYGIGRGSSVASYVLYKIGLHQVDSLKYNLDINDFIKPSKDEE
ncbi:MAG: hypothetical protein WC284_14710 [Candidimonas sp.]